MLCSTTLSNESIESFEALKNQPLVGLIISQVTFRQMKKNIY